MVDINALDYNTLKNRVEQLLGTGAGTFGYGQTVQSSSVFSGNIIRASQWDDLRNDISSILIHLNGVTPTIRDIAIGDVIDDTSADPKIQYANLLTVAESNRFDLAPDQSEITVIDTKTETDPWSSAASLTVSAQFNNANEARFFFNSGSKIQILTSRSGGSLTSQNSSWTSTLDNAGTVSFGANTNPTVNFYTLEDNSTGTATRVDIRVVLGDGYEDDFASPAPGDSVDGDLEISVIEQKASGNLQPSGSFSITSPSYTFPFPDIFAF